MKNKKIRVGINASFLRKPATGLGQVTLNFLKALSKEGDERLEIILYLEEDLPRGVGLSKKFIKRIFLPIWKRDDLIRKIWWEKYQLPRAVKKDECDVFLSLYQCPTKIKNIPHIMVVHDIIPRLFPQYLDNARKKLYWHLTEHAIRQVDKIVSVSKHTEKDLIKHLQIPGEKIITNYISIDEIYKKEILAKESARVLSKYKLKPGYILAGGGYEVRKNVEGVVLAYKFLRDKFKMEDFPVLAIYGQPFPPSNPLALDIQRMLREFNLTGTVRVLGKTDQKDMPALFKEASVFVYPSHYEGFGLPVLEAMSVGTAVLTSKKTSLPEVGGDGVLYCDPDDTHDIAMVIKNILGNHEMRKILQERGKERAKKFSWEMFTKKITSLIKNINA